MKSKFFFIPLVFFYNVGYAQKKPIQKYSTDTTLSKYISAHFYDTEQKDSCYTGIHFITIQFTGRQSHAISVSGNLPYQYTERIKQLIEKFSTFSFTPRFINYCKRKKKAIILPMLFDISSNCISYDSTLTFKNAEKILKDTTGRQILLLASHYLIVQQFAMINTFKEIGNNENTNCIILKSCIIHSKKIKNPSRA